MKTNKKFPQEASSENLNNIEIFLSKEDNQFYYLDRNRKPIRLVPESLATDKNNQILEIGGEGDELTLKNGSFNGAPVPDSVIPIEQIAQGFDLEDVSDVPAYSGNADKFLKVNASGNSVEWVDAPTGSGYQFTLNHVLGASELTSLVLSPFEIIPQPVVSAIFDFKLTFRFVAGTGAYVGSGQDLVIKNSNPYATIPTPDVISINSAMIEELKNGGMVVYGNHSADIGGYEQITPQPTSNRFLLTTSGAEFLAPQIGTGGTLYIDAEFNIIPV
jgi:hypothetical protein